MLGKIAIFCGKGFEKSFFQQIPRNFPRKKMYEKLAPDWGKFHRLGAFFQKWPKIHLNKLWIWTAFCLRIPMFLPVISLGKSSYLLRLHLGRRLDKFGHFFHKTSEAGS
jgi:hypothetical protein